MAEPLRRARVESVNGLPRAEWALGLEVSVPQTVAARWSVAGQLDPSGRLFLDSSVPAGVTRVDAVGLRMSHAFTVMRPVTSRLPFSYRWVPARVRSAGASLLGRLARQRQSRWASFPAWPLDLSADFLDDLCLEGEPSLGPTPVLLTHDHDSQESLVRFLDFFAPREEGVGARSLNFVVPCAKPLDGARLERLSARGHEIGIHGFDHSHRTPFASENERRRRIEAALPCRERLHARCYRAPSLWRTEALLHDLAPHYAADSSIPTSGGFFPAPNNGCASARPFRIGALVEIPISMPRDGSLRFLGFSPQEILVLWKATAERIASSGGVVVMLTHCDLRFSGNPPMLAAYCKLLEWLAADTRFRWANLDDCIARAAP